MLAVAGPLAVACVLAVAAVLVGAPTRGAPTARAADVAPSRPHAAPSARRSGRWSTPAMLSACPALATARVVFPSDSPSHGTGPGAIVWSASSRCPGGEGARVAVIGSGDVPRSSVIPRTRAGAAIAPRAPLTASGAPHGQIVIAGASPRTPADGLLVQGAATGPFSPLLAGGGSTPPMALATAYLGDLALASPPVGGAPAGGGKRGLNVHVERFFSRGFVRNASASAAGAGSVQALTLALDYRSEALAVWAQGGAVYARLVPNSGAARPIQRLGGVDASPRLAAVLSDDDRAIVAWSDRRGERTSVYIDRSAAGVRFGAPQLLESFRDPDGLPSPAASPSLVRLSSESVMLAWAGSADGHWVVRTAAVDLHGVLGANTIAAPAGDALLADLAPGPADDALVLWTEPLPSAAGAPDMRRQAIFAARGSDALPGGTAFDEPEEVAPPAPVSDATVALDPDSDRAVAVWRGEAGAIEYAIRGELPGA